MRAEQFVGGSARAIARAVSDGQVSATEIALAHLDHIARTDPDLFAFRRVTHDHGLRAAAAIDEARGRGEKLGVLAGVPFGLKDLFVTRGIETTAGSRILSGWIPPYESTAGTRLAAAGGVLLGKLALDEFGMGSSTENTPWEPTRNPWAPEFVPGGSSGGSAAAVAAGMCGFALGTDTGGSIRQPAAFCSVVGLKPTYGRVSRYGMIAFASSLDHVGPLAHDVRDAALILGVLAGSDPLDATSLDAPIPNYLAACDGSIRGVRIGVDRSALDLPGLDPGVRTNFHDALLALVDAGAILVDVRFAHAHAAVATYYVLCMAEAASNLARYDGIRYGLSERRDTLGEMLEVTRGAGFGPEVKRRILLGNHVLRAESYESYFGRAMRVRTLIAGDYAAAFAHCDLIASPTTPGPAFGRGERVRDPTAMYLGDVFTVGASLCGLPAISIPMGFVNHRGASLPVGLQLTAPHLGEEQLLSCSSAYEGSTTWSQSRPKMGGGP